MSEKIGDDDETPDPTARRDFAARSERATASSRRMRTAETLGTVLLVDDDDGVRRSVRRMIETEGWTVVEVSDGGSALDLLRDGLRPAVILLDVSMPRLNGYQFRLRQLSEPELAGIPIIVVSAEAEQPSAARLGAVAYIRKPFARNIILAAIAAATRPDSI